MPLKQKSAVHIYEPNKYIKINIFISYCTIFSSLISSFQLGWRIFIRDFKAKYQQQLFGFLWVIIGPFFAVLTYTLLAKASILNIGDLPTPYPLYAFLSVSLWGIIQTTIIEEAKVINNSQAFITKINFNREALLYSPLFTSLVDLLIRMVLFIFICLFYGYWIQPFNFIYILLLFPALLFSLGLGMFFSIIGAILKDVATILTYMFQFLLLITPVMYPLPENSLLGAISKWNPFYYLITCPRDFILYGECAFIKNFLYCSLLAGFVFLMGLRFYRVAIGRIIEKI